MYFIFSKCSYSILELYAYVGNNCKNKKLLSVQSTLITLCLCQISIFRTKNNLHKLDVNVANNFEDIEFLFYVQAAFVTEHLLHTSVRSNQ